ncbi:MAG: bifunctional pyr operon transcriptional regulator/uracil phosphoribosyltransferase PyrR [Bacteroidetes bacterium]|jgi:pyrimidine operon attenuation protein/uracil phosphoribosyltransferase|nr:bifunctional pyr operon transcriptional regulator/uracil phosphoribosyltransferase PyrR [Bacteroidota bacterium]MBK9399426.1 bifunctional pyr operon transcriptional regulator/uracil phosphoribosyltransferase PyrR [Bacteroidota bacterium]
MPENSKLIFNKELLAITIDRLCYQLIETYDDFNDCVIVGLQPRGVYLSKRIFDRLATIQTDLKLRNGDLDISFFRDDFRRRDLIVPSATRMDFIVEGKKVVLVDDVLFTGRTIRAGLDALLAFGRPASVELLVLIDRKFSRQLPIEPNYIGKSIDTIASEKVKVHLKQPDGEDGVWLISEEKNL